MTRHKQRPDFVPLEGAVLEKLDRFLAKHRVRELPHWKRVVAAFKRRADLGRAQLGRDDWAEIEKAIDAREGEG